MSFCQTAVNLGVRLSDGKICLAQRRFSLGARHGKFMLGWFVGRSLRRNALRDVDPAQNAMAPDARLALARRVIAQMALV